MRCTGRRDDGDECGYDVTGSTPFCPQCGTPQNIPFCPSCHGRLTRGDNFCPGCGCRVEYQRIPNMARHVRSATDSLDALQSFDREPSPLQFSPSTVLCLSDQSPISEPTSSAHRPEDRTPDRDTSGPRNMDDASDPSDSDREEEPTGAAMQLTRSTPQAIQHVQFPEQPDDQVAIAGNQELGPQVLNQVMTQITHLNIKKLVVKQAANVNLGEQTQLFNNSHSDSDEEHNNPSTSRRNASKQRRMIETTRAVVEREVQKTFIETAAFRAAKRKIVTKNLVVIKGNSGDGKTTLALRLLAWLGQRGTSEDGPGGERRRIKKAIQLHELNSWDETVAPNLMLAIFHDDILADTGHFEQWQRRQHAIVTSISGDTTCQANCLIVVIRNDVFSEYEAKLSKDGFFNSDNIVDLSSAEYIITKERLDILNVYKPNNLKLTQNEELEIVESAPNIGFPQCCCLFQDVPDLQCLKVDFFKKPLHFMDKTLSKLSPIKQIALLFLLLNGGEVIAEHLDPNGDALNKDALKAAFEIDETDEPSCLSINKTAMRLKRTLDILAGSLVTEGTNWDWRRREEVKHYHFAHDSIQDAMAIWYAKRTLMGFIQNCPTDSLSYLKCCIGDSTCHIHVAYDNSTLYKRLLRELKSRSSYAYRCLASLNLWRNEDFLSEFFKWLEQQNAVKHVYVDWTAADYLFIVYAAQVDNLPLLKHLFRKCTNRPQLKNALDAACRSASKDCALYILSRGVTPDSTSMLSTIEGGDMVLLTKMLTYEGLANAKLHHHFFGEMNILHLACVHEREDMTVFLAKECQYLTKEKDGKGNSILHLAAQTGSISMFDQMAALLLLGKNKAEIEKFLSTLVSKFKRTILHSFWMEENKDMLLHLCGKYPFLLDQRDALGFHCLHYAAKISGNVEWYKHIEACVLKNKPVHQARGYIENLACGKRTTILHASIKARHKALSLYLCRVYPGLLQKSDAFRWHPLHYVIQFSDQTEWYLEVERLTCSTNSDHFVETLQTDGMHTLLHECCRCRRKDLSLYLCEKYPNLLPKTTWLGMNCLHYLVSHSDLNWYKAMETYVIEYEHLHPDDLPIREMRTSAGESILDLAKTAENEEEDMDDLCNYLSQNLSM